MKLCIILIYSLDCQSSSYYKQKKITFEKINFKLCCACQKMFKSSYMA